MAPVEGRSLRIRSALAAAAGGVIVFSEFLPWVTAGLGSNAAQHSGLGLLPIAIAELLATAAMVVLALAAGVLDRPQLARLATVAAAIAFAFTAPLIVIVEIAGAALPTSALPETLRRNGLDLSAGVGLWIAAAAAATAVVAISGRRVRSLELRLWSRRGNRTLALALVTLLALTVLFGWLRYQTWFDTSAAGQDFDLPGWAAPWIGPLSLFAVWLLIGAFVLAALARTEPAGLLAASAGWLVTFLAAIAIIAGQTIGGLADLAAGSLGPNEADFHATFTAWAAFLLGLSVAAVGGWLVSQSPARTPRA